VFTGDEFADGGQTIADILKKNNIKASFFLTGNFYRNEEFSPIINRLKNEDHYLGPHSDKHLLYADWNNRDSLLLTKKKFMRDLNKNYKRMAAFNIKKEDALYFIPPYEWYNKSIVNWTEALGLVLVNFSPGTRSAADYTYPGMNGYRSSEEIYQSIMTCEQQDAHGLNGFILLTHIGTDERRTDKFYNKLSSLINDLTIKGYSFIRIDQLLGTNDTN
jgi:peptidoglycan/xylan/chitin deacetylase (PgdA/CDA1 family)